MIYLGLIEKVYVEYNFRIISGNWNNENGMKMLG
jgi:hypothetical protein